MARMMGFKKVSEIPGRVQKGDSIYLPLLREVSANGGTYGLDVKDVKRAATLATTIRRINKKFDCGCKVIQRGTAVYVTKD